MITKLLNEINEKIETLNNLVQDKEYFEKLDERIEKVNNYVQKQNQETERLHSIIKEVREYMEKELSFNVVINGKENKVIGYNKAFDKILEILDRAGSSNE